MDFGSLIAVCVALFVATAAQRAVGMGFGLVLAPVAAIAAGPKEAVLIVNLTGTIACAAMLPRVWGDIDWRRLAWLVVPAMALTVPGLLIASVASSDALRVAVGLLAIAGVAVSVWFTRTQHRVDTRTFRSASGGVIGLLNSSVALGAPVVGVYSIMSRWDPRPMAATMQPFWFLLSSWTLLARSVFAPGNVPAWPVWGWVLVVAISIASAIAAEPIARRISRTVARRAVIVLSIAAGVSVTVLGLLPLLSV